jgi:hypothetical protein
MKIAWPLGIRTRYQKTSLAFINSLKYNISIDKFLTVHAKLVDIHIDTCSYVNHWFYDIGLTNATYIFAK